MVQLLFKNPKVVGKLRLKTNVLGQCFKASAYSEGPVLESRTVDQLSCMTHFGPGGGRGLGLPSALVCKYIIA